MIRRWSAKGRYHDLTEREWQILRLIARGRCDAEIAATLSIAVGTIHNHITTIYSKVGLHKRSEVVAWAWQQGLVDDRETPDAETR